MPNLNSVPGDPEVWTRDGSYYLVYLYDFSGLEGGGMFGGVPVAWEISQRDLQSAFGQNRSIKIDRNLSNHNFDKHGTLVMGDADQLANFAEDPLKTWTTRMEKEAEVRPWLRDPEVSSVVLGAMLEGRQVTSAEFEQTEWWRNHNEQQRQWMLLSESDPATATRLRQDAQIAVKEQVAAADVHGLNGAVYNWLANQVVTGAWSQSQLEHQIAVLANPEHVGKLNSELAAVIKGEKVDVRHTRQFQDEVRDTAVEWLGPRYGNLSEAQLTRWANRIREDPGAMVELEDMLRKQRQSILPGYDNPNLTYEDIAAPYRVEFQRLWGQNPDEMDDPFWMKVVRSGDVNEAGALLRKEGWERGVDQVLNDTERALSETFSRVRSPV